MRSFLAECWCLGEGDALDLAVGEELVASAVCLKVGTNGWLGEMHIGVVGGSTRAGAGEDREHLTLGPVWLVCSVPRGRAGRVMSVSEARVSS